MLLIFLLNEWGRLVEGKKWKLHEVITYTMDDGRKVKITFKGQENETEVIETFDAETENPIEVQQQGWQAILNNFKKYAEQTTI